MNEDIVGGSFVRGSENEGSGMNERDLEMKSEVRQKNARKARFCFTVEEGRRIRTELLEELDGMICMEDAEARLERFFFRDEVRKWKDFSESHQKSREYFQVVDMLRNCEKISDIADRMNEDHRLILSWIRESRIPPLLKVLISIPHVEPVEGCEWLPLEAKARKFSKFVEVPAKLANEHDFIRLIENIESIDSPLMSAYEKRFGAMDKCIALMYLLGLFISDGSPVKHTITQSLGLVSSVKYSWCNNLGHAFRYVLGKMGIQSRRIKDKIFTNSDGEEFVMRQWLSSTSPLISYLGKIALGIYSEAKVQTEIKIDWIHNVPEEWRISLLQGIADGDGFVSNNWYIGISSKSHRKAISQLLRSLDIHSNEVDGELRICKYEDIKIAGRIMFRHAASRQKKLENLITRIEQSRNTPYTEQEIQLLLKLRSEGLSFAKISEVLWEEYGISRRPVGLNLKYRKCTAQLTVSEFNEG